MRRLAPFALAALLVAAVPAAGSGDAGQLVGSVGPGFGISLSGPGGSKVGHLDAGTYTLVVHDLSDEHNFHLVGPGVDVSTPIAGSGDSTFTVTLADGKYGFQCDAHPTVMRGSIFVGTATAPAPAAKPVPKPKPKATPKKKAKKKPSGYSAGYRR